MSFGSLGSQLGVKMGEQVMTYSTLPSDCYTPTAEKPYQGIFVGDYAGHGCEFLVVMQKSKEEAASVPPIVAMEQTPVGMLANGAAIPSTHEAPFQDDNMIESEDPVGCSGRLEAVKLTGDINVPRGEYSFVAEDIGHNGLVRISGEEEFKNARIVRSWGHIASRGFIDGTFSLEDGELYLNSANV